MGLGSVSLRPQLVGIGPLLPDIQQSLGISHAVAGLLVTIPVLCMGLFAPTAAVLASRVGTNRAVASLSCSSAVAGLARAVSPGAALVLLVTVPVGIGMALGNALMPLAVKGGVPGRPLLGTGVYTTGNPGRLVRARRSSPSRSPTSGSGGAARSRRSASLRRPARSCGSRSPRAGRGAWST